MPTTLTVSPFRRVCLTSFFLTPLLVTSVPFIASEKDTSLRDSRVYPYDQNVEK